MDGPASRAWRARPSHAWAARPRAGAPGDGGAAGELYRVPAHAAWFRYNAVNPIERSELPDFFSGKHAARGPAVCAPAPTPPPPRARPTERRRRGRHLLRPCGAAPGRNARGALGRPDAPLHGAPQRPTAIQCIAHMRHTGVHRHVMRLWPLRRGAQPARRQMYKEARNLMVDLYRRDVRRRLTFTEARRQLEGDAAALQRIFEFLEHWGLLNYQAPGGGGAAEPDDAPDGAHWACGAQAVSWSGGLAWSAHWSQCWREAGGCQHPAQPVPRLGGPDLALRCALWTLLQQAT